MPSIKNSKQRPGAPSVDSTRASSSNGRTRSKKRKASRQQSDKGKQSVDSSQECSQLNRPRRSLPTPLVMNTPVSGK